ILIDGAPQPGLVNFNAVGPGYFKTLGTRFISGRDFTTHDTIGSVPVAIVHELFVQKFLAGPDPTGRVFHWPDPPDGEPAPRYQVVGVVANTKYRDLREELVPIAYVPALQERELPPYLQVLAHATAAPSLVTAAASQMIREVNPSV